MIVMHAMHLRLAAKAWFRTGLSPLGRIVACPGK
jgi:hypothetical protein